MKKEYGVPKRFFSGEKSVIGVLKSVDNKDYIICRDKRYIRVKTEYPMYATTHLKKVDREALNYLYNHFEEVVDENCDIDFSSAARCLIDSCNNEDLDAVIDGVEYYDTKDGIACVAVDRNMETADLLDGVAFIDENGFYKCTKLKMITLPDTLVEIRSHAFAECRNLMFIDLPDGVRFIGDYAFENAGLKILQLPGNVEKLGDYCLSRTKITAIEIPSVVKKLGWCVFYKCRQLVSIVVKAKIKSIPEGFCMGCTSLEHINIPSTVKEIEPDAFKNCAHLQSIKLPLGLKELGEGAFENCVCLKTVVMPENPIALKVRVFKDCGELLEIDLTKANKISSTALLNCTALRWADKLPNIGS